jgi:hypothetical protein
MTEDDIVSEFEITKDQLDGVKLLAAVYECADYEGSAFVLFERDGKLYEVNGSHCSCYGLEGQWEPTITTWAALAKREFSAYQTPDTEWRDEMKSVALRMAGA